MGFVVKPAAESGNQDGADIIAAVEVITEPFTTTSDDKWKWARSTATVSLKDGKSGKVFSQFEASERQASAAQEEALRRSLAAAARVTAEKTAAAIKAYFENL